MSNVTRVGGGRGPVVFSIPRLEEFGLYEVPVLAGELLFEKSPSPGWYTSWTGSQTVIHRRRRDTRVKLR